MLVARKFRGTMDIHGVYMSVGLGCVGIEKLCHPTVFIAVSRYACANQGDGMTNTTRAHAYCILAV